jgi:hypothetical protein
MSPVTPLASYKDLCLDAVDPQVVGGFWAAVLGLDLQVRGDGQTLLTGPTPEHTVRVSRVAEAKSVKHRVHLDVNAASVEEVERLGATVLERFPRWTVMADPEGGELCVFVRDGAIRERLYEVVVDVGTDPEEAHRAAQWWGRVLGGEVGRTEDDGGFSWVGKVPGMPYDGIVFGPVPEPKTVKNRIHLDVTTPDVQELLEAGATLLRAPDDEISWSVLADPDGNEFCAFEQGH